MSRQAPSRAKPTAEQSPTTRPLGHVLSFLQLLWAVDHGLQSTSKNMEATLGVTGPQRMVLRIVGRFPGIAAGEVATILHLHPSTLTGVLRRLEERGLLNRGTDPSDGRRAVLRLSEEGLDVNRSRSGTVEAAVRRALDRLTPAQQAAAQQVLQILADELTPAE